MSDAERDSSAPEDDDETDTPMRKVTIAMPEWMHDDLRRRAKKRGITVTELMRQAVVLDQILSEDPRAQILLKKGDEIEKVILAR